MAATPRYSKPMPGCRGCSLEHNGWGFVVPVGPVSSRLVFIGEAAGAEEAIAGEPFYGAAGGVLSRVLVRAGIDRNHVRIANTVSCRPPGDFLVGAPWEHHAVNQCRQYLQPVLATVPPDAVVVPLGGTALDAVLGLSGVPGIAVKDFHGTISRDPSDRFWVVPTFHPSHLQRGAMNLLDVVTQDITTAERISRQGFTRSVSQLVVDPPIAWFRAWVSAHLAAATADPDGIWAAIDTEFEGKPEDESEAVVTITPQVRLTRFNIANDTKTGITVPYIGDYIREIDRLLKGLSAINGIALLWFKYADVIPLAAAGHDLSGIVAYDLAALAHHLHSDLPMGLGFWAAMASDFGAWKHWSKNRETEGAYAAADSLQTFRIGVWLIKAAMQLGMWELFVRDWHERDQYVLRPAHALGVPINRPILVAYHEELQRKLARVLVRIKETAAKGVLKPKLGYAKRPKGKICPGCSGDGDVGGSPCMTCDGRAELAPTPPASIMGKPKTGGGEAKLAYMAEGVKLVEVEAVVSIRACETCGAEDVGVKHRCPVPKRPKRPRRKAGDPAVEQPDPAALAGTYAPDRPVAVLVSRTVTRPRWFWQLPFNPDAPAQILAYLAQQGIAAPEDKKKRRPTTNKQALKKLAKDYRDDPFFQLQLDWKAVQKVDATYAVGTLRRLDANDRVHPEYTCRPSTLRDSAINPNLTNVVADKAGPEGLASGFRLCVEARDGVPPGVTAQELQQWSTRWES